MKFLHRLIVKLLGFNIFQFKNNTIAIIAGLSIEVETLKKENESFRKQNEILLDIIVNHAKRLDSDATVISAHQQILEQIVDIEEQESSDQEWVKLDKKDIN